LARGGCGDCHKLKRHSDRSKPKIKRRKAGLWDYRPWARKKGDKNTYEGEKNQTGGGGIGGRSATLLSKGKTPGGELSGDHGGRKRGLIGTEACSRKREEGELRFFLKNARAKFQKGSAFRDRLNWSFSRQGSTS